MVTKKSNLLIQYDNLVNKLKNNEILLFQVGDFYETFGEQAVLLSKTAHVTLTNKIGRPMSGLPIKSYENYINKILKAGYSLVIANQVETPAEAKAQGRKIVKREIIQKITKGTWINQEEEDCRTVLVLLSLDSENIKAFYGDLKTGQAYVKTIERIYLSSFLNNINPVVILSDEPMKTYMSYSYGPVEISQIITPRGDKEEEGKKIFEKYFHSRGFPMDFQWKKINNYQMLFSPTLLENLQIINSKNKGLIHYLNKTQSPMGYRTLKKFLLNPMIDPDRIQSYWNSVEKFMTFDSIDCKVVDLHRLINSCKTIDHSMKLALNIEKSLNILNSVIDMLPKYLHHKVYQVNEISIHKYIKANIDEQVPAGQGAFKNHPKVQKIFQEYTNIMTEIYMLPRKLGIKGVVKHNHIIGYFIETKNKLSTPFILKQGLAKVNRYTNEELINLSSTLSLKEQSMKGVEEELLTEILEKIQKEKILLYKLANLIGITDYINSNALCAKEYQYYQPEQGNFSLLEGRHPIIEHLVDIFIKNDYDFEEKMAIITGPNMGGKSTYLKMIALNVIMSQAGMFTPGQLTTPIYHELFTRIGAADDIFQGDSTFMVEMKECAYILNHMTDKSLIIIDEIGRGTSTKDGLSLAVAISEEISKSNALALISTHYNELAHYFKENRKITLLSMANVTHDNQFSYKIQRGICEDSFGLFVAKIVGIKKPIIENAKKIFQSLG